MPTLWAASTPAGLFSARSAPWPNVQPWPLPPLLVGALFNKAYAGETGVKATAVDVLNYALALELLEQDFYDQMIEAGQIPAGTPAVAAIAKIKLHEDQHVALLGGTAGAIRSLGGTPVSGIKFKASAISGFATNYDTQLLVAQVLEDTGVRAYKGRAPELLGTDLLTTALRIHSMEARHAAHVRYMRATRPGAATNIRPWITAADSALPAPAGPAYTSGTTGTVPTTFTFGAGTFSIPAYTLPAPAKTIRRSRTWTSPSRWAPPTRPMMQQRHSTNSCRLPKCWTPRAPVVWCSK